MPAIELNLTRDESKIQRYSQDFGLKSSFLRALDDAAEVWVMRENSQTAVGESR